mmetsp:Transcript_5567/g.14421  ORF Transcript_5567/g.14421 Transcript_5567/m.14421 type:complete len:268 (+) Transcript_5567:196-999(+)
MPGPPLPMPWSCSEAGLRTVSSTLRMRQVASVAAWSAFLFTTTGSHTNEAKVSVTPPVSMSIPTFFPVPSDMACLCLSLFRTSVESKPALSQSWRGMISSALAYALMKSCSLPISILECSRSTRETSMSTAPPPGTMAAFFTARRTIMMASWMLLWASSMNCSAPPRSTMVAVLAWGQPVKRLYLSFPTCFSSNLAHAPSTPGRWRSFTEVCTMPPAARATLCMSSSATRPAQNMPRSAKYCVARSPMARRESTTCAPDWTHLSSLS